MLVLTRKLEEQIVIGDNIRVTILRIKGNTVRVGIEAPRQVRVVRAELPPNDASRIAAANRRETSLPARPEANAQATASAGDMKRSAKPAESGASRCPPPLAAYLVGLIAHAS